MYHPVCLIYFKGLRSKNSNLDGYNAHPGRIPLDEKNTRESVGAELSLVMNLEELDKAPELLLNQIIWKSIKKPGSGMPMPLTSRDWVRDLD